MKVDLGTIRKLPMTELWKHEELEFTPWLASDSNISQLAEAIGLELQVEGIEVPVGPFTADILAKQPSGEYVVIENQFGKTDHDHFGKMLTYAATLGATTVVWVAERFTDEHRKAIEWLNEHTTEELNLYAIEAELWVIDNSRPALRLNVLSEPTEIARQAANAKARGPLTEAQKLQLEFWTGFRAELLKRKVVPTAQSPRAQYWFDVSVGRSGFTLSNLANTTEGRIGTRLYINNRVADAALEQLGPDRAQVEAEIGEPLQWNPYPEKRDKVIMLSRPADLEDRTRWPEYFDWLVERVARFKRTFGPRVKTLSLSPAATADASDSVTSLRTTEIS